MIVETTPPMSQKTRQISRLLRYGRRCLLVGATLAFSLGLPLGNHSFILPAAHAHHGGGGSGGGGSGGGGSGGGKGDGVIKSDKSGAIRSAPEGGYGKGGRGHAGLKS